ncbi:telomerase reverse transcriptase-like [Amyelois transitella]|uniref:telomerase reverse transcriptase-like n=1 Tax=Amyelois transitella TaxID=680683 RepID=UPI00298FB4E1|nr:telomerase reverse transcriptase-like [Amyelois transitella]
MEEAVCFSQSFVDKQNVRSFSNIVKPNLLKEDAPFLLHVLKDEKLVSVLSTDIIQVLSKIKTNVREKSRHDFKQYFIFEKNDSTHDLQALNKTDIFSMCHKALNDIIPSNFFGGKDNERLFQRFVQVVIYSTKRQHILLKSHTRKWNFAVGPWKSICGTSTETILTNIIIWIIDNILSSMICLNFYVTTCKLDADEYKLYYFKKNQWQSFYDRTISNMVLRSVITKVDCYCVGKQVKRSYSHNKKRKLKSFKKDIPKLHLVLKKNNDCRPIVRYKSDSLSLAEKYKIRDRLNFLKSLTGKPHTKIENQFSLVYNEWLKRNKPRLYFVKTDLSNAFGAIDREALLKILDERYRKYKSENIGLTEKFKQQYKELIAELRKPILVRAGSTIFNWKKGLVQGYKYSPALSELYYTHMDEIYFSQHLQKAESGIRLFIRVVDDYLYITDSLKDGQSFLDALTSYKNVNYEKTVTNFHQEGIKFSEEITILGYTYNTLTLHVRRANNVFTGQMCYKIAFSQAIMNLYNFLEQRIGQSSIHINEHLFNLRRNTEEEIWTHIFTTLCLSANKFCTILAILCDGNAMKQYLSLYKKKVTVKLCNTVIETLMKNKYKDVPFVYCINHFRYLSWKALIMCAQKTPRCTTLVPFIGAELAKCNCLFGRWREHASRIDGGGVCSRPAVREICRRSDWRVIMKKFDELPPGFECYNRRKFLEL